MIHSITNPVLEFALAILEKDRARLERILSDGGKFEAMNYQFDIVTVNEYIFMDWIMERLQTITVTNYTLDFDAQYPNRPVILFNNGQFPAIHTELNDKYLLGLGLVHNEHTIEHIYFCHEFLHTPNYTIAEKMQLDMEKLMLSGIDEATARATIFGT